MSLSHSATRLAYSAAIDSALKYIGKDRDKNLIKLVDLTEKYMGDNFKQSTYDAIRKTITNKDSKWLKYIDKLLTELSPNVVKMTALNLGYEVAFNGTKTIREMRQIAPIGTGDFRCLSSDVFQPEVIHRRSVRTSSGEWGGYTLAEIHSIEFCEKEALYTC